MKAKLNQLMQTIVGFVKSHVLVTVIAGALVVVLVVGIALAAGLSSGSGSNTSSEDESGQISDETMVDIHINMEEDASSQNESSSAPATLSSAESSSVQSSAPSGTGSTSSKPSGSSKPTTSNPAPSSKPASSNKVSSAVSNATSSTSAEKTVRRIDEGYNGLGLKYVRTFYTDGTSTSIVECAHCRQMPCPDGGGANCSEYSIQKDSTVTCQLCGKPKGDGHNGTCYRTVDWSNGGKVTCHHYD